MSTTARLWTADELLRRPDDGQRCELVRGELRVMSPAGGRHGQVIVALATLLAQHVRAHRLGVVFSADTGFRLGRDPDTVRAPDIAFMGTGRIRADDVTASYIEGAPDLAVEVLSPGDTVLEVEDKVAEYLDAGARLVWVINPKRRRATVYAPHDPPRLVNEDERLDGGDVVPGFACQLRDALDW